MAVTAPEAPSLHFKERSGFITKRAIFRDDVESDEEEVAEEDVEEEEIVEDEEFFEEEEFFEDEPFEEEFFEEEFFEEEPVEEEFSEEAPVEQVAAPAPARREPTVTVQPADTGGRTGSALPTAQEMAAYAQEDRGKAIIRHFEEEDRRMSQQRSTQTSAEAPDEPWFNVEPPSGGMKWVVLIVVLAMLGFTIVRQLAMGPRTRASGFAPDVAARASEIKENALTEREALTEVMLQRSTPPPPNVALNNVPARNPHSVPTNAAPETSTSSTALDERPAVMRALREVSAAYAAEESKSSPKPRVSPKVEPKKDGVNHIEIRI